jgi:membrane-associated phospholipid phosphatase
VRAGCGMSRLSAWAAWARQGPPEPPLLAAPRRDAVIAALAAALTAAVFIVAADSRALAHIQRLDDSWLRLMISGRTAPVTAIAKVFNVLGLVYVTLPIRIAVIGYLGFRRRWWRLAAFGSAVLLSEILIGLLKGVYNRARPPGSLVATSGASFPSGHSIAASVTVLAMVIALVPAGPRRVAWAVGAVIFAVMMAASRAYLGAHWLSDAIAGLLLGICCALITATAVDYAQRRYARSAAPATARSVPSADLR